MSCHAGEVVYLPQLEGNMLGRAVLHLVGAYSQKQQLRNGASVMYQGITEAAENTELQQGEPTAQFEANGNCRVRALVSSVGSP